MHGFASYRHFEKARSLRNDRNVHVLGHYVVTKLGSKLDRYVATEQYACLVVRSDRAWLELGRYVATELCAYLVAVYRSSLAFLRSDCHTRACPRPIWTHVSCLRKIGI
uniref:Uncharacterized protein n=1 Tax=Brassica campestris TaxID=3711 RepID=M4F056_BRACM